MLKKITIALITISVILLIPIESFAGRGGGGGGGGMGGGMGGMGGMGGATGGTRTGTRTGITGGFTNTAGGTASVVGTEAETITLIPVPEKKWIIARGSAELMEVVKKLIDELDKKDIAPSEYETFSVAYVDVTEVAQSLVSIMQDLNPDYNRNVSIQPLSQSRQILVFGKEEYRNLVKTILTEIDLPSNSLQRRSFKLDYADPTDIKEKIDELFSLTGSTTSSSTSRTTATRTSSGSSNSGMLSADTVLTTIYPSLRQIVVLASEANMQEIEKIIKEWDSPFVWEKTKPRIVSVKNIDPVQLVTLLNGLFSTSTTSSGTSTNSSTRNLLNSSTSSTTASIGESIIGPLYGKLNFVEIPDTRKLIVASSVAEAYDVIEKFIHEIDDEDPAVVPKVVALKYADPEDLSRRLNTVFAESGTSSSIEMSVTGLSTASYIDTTQTASTATAESYTPPWSGSGGTSSTEEMPISNIFGKVRFMPEPNTKSILLLAPSQFMVALVDLINELDVTGKQVMIETIIVEVEHNAMTSLGMEFSSNGAALSSIGRYGLSASAIIGNPSTYSGQSTELQNSDDFFLSGSGLSVFIDFLKKKGNARVLNQQTLWTKDNEEANFFKGKKIPIVTGTTETTSSTGAVVSSNTYDFQLVGMEVRVRPRITPENNVGMIVNVNYSQQTGDTRFNMDILSQMNSTTNMIIQDGDTLILGGILFQTDSVITYKIPGLGDIPLLGKLFGHDATNKENTELLVFIKPSVIDKAPEHLEDLIKKTKEVIEKSKVRMDQIRNGLDDSLAEVNKD
jgi:general secretion pathway protein D